MFVMQLSEMERTTPVLGTGLEKIGNHVHYLRKRIQVT